MGSVSCNTIFFSIISVCFATGLTAAVNAPAAEHSIQACRDAWAGLYLLDRPSCVAHYTLANIAMREACGSNKLEMHILIPSPAGRAGRTWRQQRRRR